MAKHYPARNRLEAFAQLSVLNQGTPKVSVLDNRGWGVRELGYYRRAENETAEVRISRQRYNSAGQLVSAIDPRLSVSYLKDPSSVIPNQQQKSSLLGGVLQSDNVDAGKRVVLSDSRGKSLWSHDSRETERYFNYDKLRRVQTVYEKEKGQAITCTEYFVYGALSSSESGQNTVGQLIEAYGRGGRKEIKAYSLLGQVKKETQTYLKADVEVNWTADSAENAKRLEDEGYRSEWRSNALGETVSQIDAKGNKRKTAYEISGQIKEQRLKLNTGSEKILSNGRVYTANGQLAEENLGNGIQMSYRYEAATQRLSEKEATRISDNQSLQFLHYTYDPVGNILSIEDRAKAIEHFNNEKTEPINHYVYDSFYQLIESQGIESSQAGKETVKIPQATPLGNTDASRLVNYKRSYCYDAGGNLFQIQHHGASRYTQKLQIDEHSNRGIEKRETGPNLQESFDGNGNLLYLNVGQPLSWDSRNQLQEAVQLERETNADKEVYVYDSQGSRVEKRRCYQAQSQTHTERVRYLPGLELREKWQSDSPGNNKKITEELHVIQAQAGEPARVLHWEQGQPEEIENDNVYYSLSDQIGSNQLELNEAGEVVSYESYYPYGGTAIWATKNQVEASYKYRRYSGKERDITGLYYYGYRYYLPWLGRWVNADPSGISEGLNLFQMVNNNPITFHDPDGRAPTTKKTGAGAGQPTFKGLYPETAVDETGETYRFIKEVGSFKNPFEATEVAVRSFEYGPRERGFYLFTGFTRAKRLMIESHGSFHPRVYSRDITLNENTPTIVALGPHEAVLYSNTYDYNKSYAEISHQGIALSSVQAERDLQGFGYAKVTGTDSPETFYNYTLSKYETHVENPDESRFSHRLEYTVSAVNNSRRPGQEPVDILSIRKYRGGPAEFYGARITVEDVISLARKLGYEKVILNHCRNHVGSVLESYDVDISTMLPEPIFKVWGEMKLGRNPFE